MMRRHATILCLFMAASLLCLSAANEEAVQKLTGKKAEEKENLDYGAFQAKMKAMSKKERREYELDMNEKFISRWGEKANELRLCQALDLNDTTSDDLWIDNAWMDTNVRYLDIDRYNDWVATQKEGDKPWLVIFGLTPYGQQQSQQTTNLMMKKIMCLDKHFGDNVNYGFVDFKKGEKIIESYDYEMHYGQMAPYLMWFQDGKAYHMLSKNWSSRDLMEFIERKNYTAEARYVEPVKRARNSLNLFVEYACKEVANLRQLQKAYQYMHKNHNETWWFQNIVAKNFSQRVPRKTQGWTLITWVITPLVLLALYLFHWVVKLIWRCLGCSKSKDVPVPLVKVQQSKKRDKID